MDDSGQALFFGIIFMFTICGAPFLLIFGLILIGADISSGLDMMFTQFAKNW